ncbi:MAG: tetratricopeptide repeat protein [Rhodothermales bacterium]
MLVIALFMVTALSKDRPANSTDDGAQATSIITPESLPPLTPELADRVQALGDEIARLDESARIEKQRELVRLLYTEGRLDWASFEQRNIAGLYNKTEDWKRTGNLFYDWMETLSDQDQRKPQVAQQAIMAYQRYLEVHPNDLDVRTDMATAYLATNAPMQGVTEIKRVLDADSTHIKARFNYGVMLWWISRTDQAVEQFEKVKAMVGPDSEYYQQAEEAIRTLQAGATM